MMNERPTNLDDFAEAILSKIFSLVIDTRTRNAMSLVCIKWQLLERSTRTSLTLRGKIRDLFLLPRCFMAVRELDLSFISPWGNPLLDSSPKSVLIAQLFGQAFPSVVSLTIYARNITILSLLAPLWPNLGHVKLVRWHQRLAAPLGSDIVPLFEHCHSLSSLDLSRFYCWTEDLPPALEAFPIVAASLSHLNILTNASTEGFKSNEIVSITTSCPNLRQLLAACVFDRRFMGFVGNETLLALAANCPRLSLLHLADISSFSSPRGDPDDEGYTSEDADIGHTTLQDLFSGLPLLEVLVLDVCHNVRDSGPSLELLNSKCPHLKSLKLGQFHGICKGVDYRPDGIAVCKGLESLSIKNCADLTDSGLIAISLGCPRLAKFEVDGSKKITETGMRKFASLLHRTLTEVRISSCKNLSAMGSLQALEPIRSRIQRLHIDCVWEKHQTLKSEVGSSKETAKSRADKEGIGNSRFKFSSDVAGTSSLFQSRTWARLKNLSLWIYVGDLLTPLPFVGLEDCPVLEEIQIKIEGDSRQHPKPSSNDAFGLSSLRRYPRLSKMTFDCGDVIGFALTAPCGHVDLSIWERFYLSGIQILNLTELDYWPPQDTDVNRRALSLPGAGLLAQCASLRKLFIHGTANEHFMMFLLRIQTLRDAQLREDYYPAPENDSTTEMRVESCLRFEDALNSRSIPD